jgi:hypothetical protein
MITLSLVALLVLAVAVAAFLAGAKHAAKVAAIKEAAKSFKK